MFILPARSTNVYCLVSLKLFVGVIRTAPLVPFLLMTAPHDRSKCRLMETDPDLLTIRWQAQRALAGRVSDLHSPKSPLVNR